MKLIKLKEVTEMTTLSKATIYRLMSKGEFPGVVRLGPRAVAWMQSEVIKWIDSKA
ncbi:helix-turn-helix transcriptional regulator, partial [Aeromonas salmonicida]|uniref:helix-turn-helix transcriptional regulator n=2 Tax=Aeromonadaceae TaxID=84642 RepID=UPI001C5ED9F0